MILVVKTERSLDSGCSQLVDVSFALFLSSYISD